MLNRGTLAICQFYFAATVTLVLFSCQADSATSCIRATQVLVGWTIKPDHVVFIQGDHIENIQPWSQSLEKKCQHISEVRGLLTPGFVDIHIHGAGGRDVMEIEHEPEALKTIGRNLLREGVTTWLPTTISASPERLKRILARINQHTCKQGLDEASIAGIHMEGPFISKEKPGCHPLNALLAVNFELMDQWQQASANSIRIITFAPELEHSSQLIEWCKRHNVIASIGHTNASETVTQQAIADGAMMGTHLFNGMSQSKSRDAGAAFTILTHSRIPFEVIMDGVHLSDNLVRIAWQLSRSHPERFVLVSDAISAKGLPEKNGYHWLGGNLHVRVEGYKSVLANNPETLAGSVLTIPFAIETMLRITGCSISEALLAASYNPAKSINLHHQIGLLSPGMKADMVLLSETRPLSIKLVWHNGKRVI